MTFRPALALAPLALLVACKPEPAVLHRMNGDDLMSRSDFAGAAAEYAQSLGLAPAHGPTWEKLAFAKLKAGDKDGAAEALARRAELEKDPAKKAEDYRSAAGIFLQGGEDPTKAERYLVEAIRADPADEASLSWLGELASQRGGARVQSGPVVTAELDRALDWYGRVIAVHPDARSAHANRRIVITRYLPALDDERAAQAARLKRAGKDAAAVEDAKARIARAEARTAELKALLAESNAKLAPAKAASAPAK